MGWSSKKRAAPEEVRFAFGKNWTRFLAVVDEGRVAEAERSLTEMLGVHDLKGRSFLDAGSGSGLFSLAARRLGATRVHSFDFDPHSVTSTHELKRRFAANDAAWTIEHGSVLDAPYLASLGTFDVVYSWGVLHHTGDLWGALRNIIPLVKPGGRLFIAIYNDQGASSRRWWQIKRAYNHSRAVLRGGLLLAVGAYFVSRRALGWCLRWRDSGVRSGTDVVRHERGMSRWYDLVDWVGGYPFEVAKPEDIFDFCQERGLVLRRLKTVGGGLGNNQFVFLRGDHS
jgi:2-polyprenyl-3-methyl-5-hydroxy-6-metoxy-1,4-benzoquinol methylase